MLRSHLCLLLLTILCSPGCCLCASHHDYCGPTCDSECCCDCHSPHRVGSALGGVYGEPALAEREEVVIDDGEILHDPADGGPTGEQEIVPLPPPKRGDDETGWRPIPGKLR